ncbi:hypothetical protein CAPTEDRAFT_132734, partial [Capitella teleta]
CLLSPLLFNAFPERIKQNKSKNHQSSISIGAIVVSNTELQDLTDKLVHSASAFDMEVIYHNHYVVGRGRHQSLDS